jgi:mono/diheme cytochrome c family protein
MARHATARLARCGQQQGGTSMAMFPIPRPAPPLACIVASPRRRRCGAVVLSALWLAGCAVEVQNLQPAQELAQATRTPGSTYTGWRVFQEKCAGCHGADATGTSLAPDLLLRVGTMESRRFVAIVLTRYDWNLPAAQAGSDSEALIDAVVQRRVATQAMPAWQGEPRVNAHIVDLYAYLSARADGSLGAGRPAP